MSLKPVYGVGTGRFGLAAILAQSIGHCAQKLSGNPLSPQRTVHKGMVDDSNALLFREGYFTFAKGSSLTTHRIVAVTDEGYRTQGVPTMPLTRTLWPPRKWWAAWWAICRASAACWRP